MVESFWLAYHREPGATVYQFSLADDSYLVTGELPFRVEGLNSAGYECVTISI